MYTIDGRKYKETVQITKLHKQISKSNHHQPQMNWSKETPNTIQGLYCKTFKHVYTEKNTNEVIPD